MHTRIIQIFFLILLYSNFCVAILKNQRKYKKSTDTACVVLTILIIMSTMFLKQHSVVDVVLAALMYTRCYRIIYGNELWSQNAFRTSIFSDHSWITLDTTKKDLL